MKLNLTNTHKVGRRSVSKRAHILEQNMQVSFINSVAVVTNNAVKQ